MRSLLFRLMIAFALVVFLGTLINSLLVSRMTRVQFRRYLNQSGLAWAEGLAPILAEYYAANGGWQGVEDLLDDPWLAVSNTGNRQGGFGWGAGGMMGGGMMHGRQGMGAGMIAMMGINLLLVDNDGVVIADSLGNEVGEQLSRTELTTAVPILVGTRQVGSLLAVMEITADNTLSRQFLSTLGRSTWLASLTSVALALFFGWLLSRQIVAPVRAVTIAARKIAAGDLDQRVPVNSRDEIGELAQSFNQMADALKSDQQLRRNMIVDIAHELGTPLSVVRGNLEAMLDGVLPLNTEEIASLHDEITLLIRLVNDLRLLSLAEAGQLKLERRQTDLTELVNRIVDNVRLSAEAQGVNLVIEVERTLPLVEVDPDRIAQVMHNLLDNALRYTSSGGRITVRTYRALASRGAAGEIIVEVSDTGTGIAAQDLPHIFDRFYRADKSRSRGSGGSGIGLAIVKQLVEAHGGRVWVRSEMGNGASFGFSLPL